MSILDLHRKTQESWDELNIYEFIYSPDVAAHCEEIGFEWNAFETAAIVTASNKTLPEKQVAYRAIIKNMPVELLPPHCYKKDESTDLRAETVQGYLEWRIAMENRGIQEFSAAQEGYVFLVYRQLNGSEAGLQSKPTVCTTFDQAVAGIMRPDENYLGHTAGFSLHKVELNSTLTAYESAFANVMMFNAQGEIMELISRKEEEWQSSIYEKYNIENTFVRIPVPFEVGDILCLDETPVVLHRLPNEKTDTLLDVFDNYELGKRAFLYEMTDNDMNGSLKMVNIRPDLLCYWNEPLQGKDRFLLYLSDYIKRGEEKIGLLFYALARVREQIEAEQRNDIMRDHGGFENDFWDWKKELQPNDSSDEITDDEDFTFEEEIWGD